MGMQAGRDRLISYQSEDPSPTIPPYWMKENGKTVGDENGARRKANKNGIGPDLETRQSHTIKFKKIIGTLIIIISRYS